MSRLASQPVLQWLRNASADALELRVDALEPEHPETQCFVSANLKIAGLHAVVKATVAVMCWALPG